MNLSGKSKTWAGKNEPRRRGSSFMPPELNPAALNIPLRKMFSGSGSGDIFTGGGTPVKMGSRVAFDQRVPGQQFSF
jgi:hypothetical protein